MSSMPECKRCGGYVSHGPVICGNCMEGITMSDARRLKWVMQDIDGFACLSADKWEYAQDEATRNGREEPNESDMMDGIRRMIDWAMLSTPNTQ